MRTSARIDDVVAYDFELPTAFEPSTLEGQALAPLASALRPTQAFSQSAHELVLVAAAG